MNKLKGFTILEALISLMLISIIIGLTYSIFNLIGKQMTLFEKESNEVLQYNLFNTTLKYDIETANDFNTSQNILYLKYYNETDIIYKISNSYILREHQENIDTFEIKTLNYNFIKNRTSTSYGETIFINFNMLGDTIQANYYLKKDNSQIINEKYFSED